MPADDKSPLEYRDAPEVAEIARQLISRVAAHHELVNAHIEYVFRSKAAKSHGHETWGKAHKIGGLQAWLANPEQPKGGWSEPMPFFLVEFAHDVWQRLDDNQRVALVDHELCHCAVGWDEDGAMQLSMRHHDVEEFLGVISRNGLWRDAVQQLGVVASEQLSLAFDRVNDPPPGGADRAGCRRAQRQGCRRRHSRRSPRRQTVAPLEGQDAGRGW